MLRYVPGSTVVDAEHPEEGFLLSSDNIRTKIKTSGLYAHTWVPDSSQRRLGSLIKSFSKDAKEYKLDMDFFGTREERASNINLFNQLTEKDILNKTPGRLFLDEQYIQCYVVGSEYTKSDRSGAVRNTATVYAPEQFWITEVKVSLNQKEDMVTLTDTDTPRSYKVYPYSYAYTYEYLSVERVLNNPHWSSCDFQLIIYGPATKPTILIGSNIYQIDYELDAGEYIEISSDKKTAYCIHRDGSRESVLGYRNTEYYLFEKIAEGNQIVSWSGTHAVDITLIMKRSEPDWT